MPLFLDEPEYPTARSPRSVAVADFNRDSRRDLAAVSSDGSSVSVLLGNGDGTFQTHLDYVTGDGPQSLTVGDFNHDGKPDLAVADNAGVSVLLGNGDGTFQPHVDYATATGAAGIASGDFNADNKPDLVVANEGASSVSVLLGNGDGTFQAHIDYTIAGVGPVSVAIGDFNGDSRQDLAVTNSGTDDTRYSLSILLGNGDGSFGLPMHSETKGGNDNAVAVADFNNDGRQDLAVSDSRDSVSVLLGNGDGTFKLQVDYAPGYAACSVTVGDFNGDGRPDVATANCSDNSLSILLGNGDGTFQNRVDYPTGNGPQSVAVEDFNGDGKPDVAVANEKDSTVSVLLGKGDGTLQTRRPYYSLADYSLGFAFVVGDFNNDGKPDVAVAKTDSQSVLLGNGDGTFQGHVNTGALVRPRPSAAVGDFNGDGWLDLAVADGSSSVSVALGNGDGSLQGFPPLYETGLYPYAVAVGDFNGDGKLDLAVADGGVGQSDSVSVLLGNGDGSFRTPSEYPIGGPPDAFDNIRSVAGGDFNGDGKLDIVTTSYNALAASVLLGNGDGTFQPHMDYPTGGPPTSVAIGDFNLDGKPDFAVANWSHDGLAVFLGNGDGTFQTQVYSPPGDCSLSVAVADFDDDGKPDLALTDVCKNSVSVLLGNGDGSFQGGTEYATGQACCSALAADFNLDGATDLGVLSPGINLTILLNLRGSIAELQSLPNPSILDQPVTLTATVRALVSDAGLATPTGTVAFMEGTNELGKLPLGADGEVKLPVNKLTAGSHNLSAIYGGDTNFNPHTVTLTQVVNGPDFGMSATPGSTTLRSGSSAMLAITVTPLNGFSGAVSLTCSVSPTLALAPTCSLNPNSVTTTASGSAISTLTVLTTGVSAYLNPVLFNNSRLLYALWLPISGIAWLGVGVMGGRTRKRKMILLILLMSLCLMALGLQSACGGGRSSPPRGTPPGQYTVTVNATSGSIVHSTSVTITVQ